MWPNVPLSFTRIRIYAPRSLGDGQLSELSDEVEMYMEETLNRIKREVAERFPSVKVEIQ